MFTNSQVCMNLRDKGWKQEWIDDQMVSYAYSGNQWVGYEDRRSMAFKVILFSFLCILFSLFNLLDISDFGVLVIIIKLHSSEMLNSSLSKALDRKPAVVVFVCHFNSQELVAS